uniref:Retrovirus-related Pol polyprotein from transposon TNT 1-94-like beta-barrel domain-containing protein n=1 Tax=Phytophthora ramorum TaxID=164328 RepID=H3GXI1_PHYRM
MSPTTDSSADDRDFPRLNGRNFVIWKTRVTAALEGKNLIGFGDEADYAGDEDYDFSSDEDLNPALADMGDAVGAPKATDMEDSSSSESSSDSSSEAATAGDDGDSFTAKKRDDLKRAEKLKAKSLKLSSRKLRLDEAKAKAFLIKTIDDQHVLMVKDKTTAYEIFQTLCSKYEGAAIHGDPYYIQSYLMALKYEEGSDLMAFIIDLEESMKAAAEATNIWKGSRKFIPYEDLKRHIETKVQNELARNRYVLRQGTPESKETRAERALRATAPIPMPADLQIPAKMETALVASLKCTYCQRDNHDTVDCYILQRHLRDGQIKAGTVLPANFKLKAPQGTQSHHPYKGNYKGNRGNNSWTNYHGRGNNNRAPNGKRQDRRGNHSRNNQGKQNEFHGRRNQDAHGSDNNEYGIIAITTLDCSPKTVEVSLTAHVGHHDPSWTIDSGCTRHVTSNREWFVTLKPTAGKSITVGGNHQIPIAGTGDVKLSIKDTKGRDRVITLINVLYAPDLKFNLLSVRQAVETDYKINFPNAKKCVLFYDRGTKFEAKTGNGTRLYQFEARPVNTDHVAHVAKSGSG